MVSVVPLANLAAGLKHTDSVLEIPYQDFPGTYQRTSTVPAKCVGSRAFLVNSSPRYQRVPAHTSSYQLVPDDSYCLPIRLRRPDIRTGTLVRTTKSLVPDCCTPIPACAPPSPTPQCVKPKKVVLARVKRWRGHRLSTLHFANHACFTVQILPRRLLEENMAESCAQTLYVSYCKRP